MPPSPSSTVTVVIDGYTHNSILTSGDSVPLGTQIILVCRVVGVPYGTPLNYTWTCPNGYQCETERSYVRKIHSNHTLAVNITSVYISACLPRCGVEWLLLPLTLVGGVYTGLHVLTVSLSVCLHVLYVCQRVDEACKLFEYNHMWHWSTGTYAHTYVHT